MKKILINALKIAFIAYTLSLTSYFNATFTIVLAAIFALILPIHSLIFILPFIITKDYFIIKILASVIAINICLSFIIKSTKKTIFITLALEMIVVTILYAVIKDVNIANSIASLILSLTIITLFNFLYSLSYENKNTCYINNLRIFEIFLLAISFSNILISDSNHMLILFIIILSYLRYLLDKYSFSFVSLLTFMLFLLFIDKTSSPIILILTIALFIPSVPTILFYALFSIYFHKLEFFDSIFVTIPVIVFYLINFFSQTTKITEHSVKTLDLFDRYLNITDDFLNKTSNTNLTIDAKIHSLYDTYCVHCTNLKNCIKKNKVDTYNYLYLCSTYQGDLRTLNIPNTLKKFIINCPCYIEMLNTEKVEGLTTNNTPVINHIHELTKCLKQEIGETKDYIKYYNLESYLIKLGYRITDFNVKIKDNLPEMSFKVLNASPDKITSVLVNQASFYFKASYDCTIKNNEVFLFLKPKIKLTFQHHSMAKNNDVLSGDNFFIKKEHNYRYMFALSDGMGSGFNAFCQSKEMLNLVNNISKLSLNTETNVNLINNVYRIKSNPENYATLDLLQIDCVNKEAILFKMGGTNTYLLSGKTLKVLYNNNPPLGFSNLNESFKFKISRGDIIIMLSDGVTEHIQTEDLNEFLSSLYFKNTTRIVHDIIEYVSNKQKNGLKDDLSALAIKIV